MTKLDRETVIRAALGLLNEVGVDGLTTRRLAERLRVQQPALYWHFRNKRALLDALAGTMLAERHIRSMPREGEDWRVFLRENAQSFRSALLAYRDGALIHAGTRPASPQFDAAEAQIRLLCGAGFSAREAAQALAAISHYTVGAVIEQQAAEADMAERQGMEAPAAPPPPAFLQQVFDELENAGADVTFDYGLDTIIAGLERKLSGG
ncbi:tetracycline resistance transcriptional repressor TetR [Rhizobium sp. LCM 4573]|uniref:tetracycline resistance transcriptional repressor TetR n=1 Tax=Rhizobium sp. LCM 4573 TaxID=1848291 RepID=UPI0008D90522|nr:tetracycline resistance transcriptional repressor TetR [Rhizobium sp. LCM 4573]OHV75622.1 TetR family transcriptional regulator [Rhizobium sp. LCM 4573]